MVSGSGFRVPGSGIRDPDFGFWCSGLRISGSGIRVPGFGVRVDRLLARLVELLGVSVGPPEHVARNVDHRTLQSIKE